MSWQKLLILGVVFLGLILSIPNSSRGGEFHAGNYPDITTQTSTDNSLTTIDSNECQDKIWKVPTFLRYADVYCCDATYKLPCLENKQTLVDKFIALVTPMEQKMTFYCSKNYVPEPPPCEVSALPGESQEDTLTRSIESCVTQIKGMLDRINQQLDHCDPEAPPVIY
jgi:hypothetical protein